MFLSILGSPANAADPERFFRLSGLICCALRAKMLSLTLSRLSFLKYNKEYWPSDKEVFAAYFTRRVELKQQRKEENERKRQAEVTTEYICCDARLI